MPTTIIQAIREWLATCPLLDVLAGDIGVDWVQENPDDYGIFPAGESLISEDMAGNMTWQYNAYIVSTESTVENLNRLNNSGFMENFHRWINGYSRVGFELPENCDFVTVSASNGLMDNISEDGTAGRYRIAVNLTYERTV